MGNVLATNKKPNILINRNYAFLWSGHLISVAGDYLFDTTLVLWITTQIARGASWAPLAVSGVLLAATLPTFLVGPFAGVFVDRWDKRRTMLWMDGMRAICIALLLPLTGIPFFPFLHGDQLPIPWELGILYFVVFLSNVCAQFFNPSAFALIGELVEEASQARATGLNQMTGSIAMLAGPPLATMLFFAMGTQLAILFNALSFVISFLTTLAIQVPLATHNTQKRVQNHFWSELGEGLRFSLGNHIIRTLLVAGSLVIFCEGTLTTLGIFFLQQNLHAPLTLYGFLATAMGAGLTLGALLAAIFVQRLGIARVLGFGLLIYGLGVLIYARVTDFSLALIIQFLLGLLVAAVNVASGPLLFSITPKELLGRVMALANPIFAFCSLLAIGVAGYLDSTALHTLHTRILGMEIGPIDTIFFGAGMLATCGGLYAVVNQHKDKMRNTEDNTRATPEKL